MSSGLLKNFAVVGGNLYGVLDVHRIMADLKEMRRISGKNQLDFEALSGVTRWSIQAIESGHGPLHVSDLEKWLTACGTSLPLYLRQHLAEDDRAALAEDRELMKLCRMALRIPAKREAVRAVLKGLFAAAKRRAK